MNANIKILLMQAKTVEKNPVAGQDFLNREKQNISDFNYSQNVNRKLNTEQLTKRKNRYQ